MPRRCRRCRWPYCRCPHPGCNDGRGRCRPGGLVAVAVGVAVAAWPAALRWLWAWPALSLLLRRRPQTVAAPKEGVAGCIKGFLSTARCCGIRLRLINIRYLRGSYRSRTHAVAGTNGDVVLPRPALSNAKAATVFKEGSPYFT